MSLGWIWDTLRDWTWHTPWRLFDSNFHVGSSQSSSTLTPLVFIAACAALFIALHFLRSHLRGINASSAWQGAGVIVLCAWIVLDLFWQYRLLRHNQYTLTNFAGRSNEAKLLNTIDGDILILANQVRQMMEAGGGERLFVGGGADYLAMSSVYYLSPINTHWQRRGSALPERNWLASGDHILLLRPTSGNYDSSVEVLDLFGGSLVTDRLVENPLGLLLRLR